MFSRKALPLVLIAICIVLAVSSCSGTKKDKTVKVTAGLAGRVDDLKITQEQMLRLFEELPTMQKKQFKGRDGQAMFTERLIEQHLLYKAAIDDKIDRTDEMEERLRWTTMNIIVAEYFSKNITDKIKVEPNEIEDYYAAHTADFTQPRTMRAQYIFTVDSLKAVKLHKRLAQGEVFATLAMNESEDKETARKGGDLGYFNPNGYITGVGTSEVFSAAVENLEVGQLSGIIRFEKGFAIVKVTEKKPMVVQTLDEARQAIETRLRSKKMEEGYKTAVEKLRKKYKAENYVKERLNKTIRTPEEFWEVAQIEPDPRERIQYYREIVNLYPDHKNAPEALFMIGFTYAEDLKDFPFARRTFEELEKKYPQSTMIESAKWMMENMETAHPKMESIETMQQRMETDKARKVEKGE